MDAAAGTLLGFFSWIGYRQLSIIDPFQARGLSGLLIFGFAGALLYRGRARAIVWAVAGSLLFMILVVGYTPIIRSPAQALVRSDSATKVDAVVALSSSISDDELLDQQGMDRLLAALQLIRQGVAPNLVITSITGQRHAAALSSLDDQARLVALMADRVNVIYTPTVGNTRDEAIEVAAIAREKGWRTIALVTSPTHTGRACKAFEKVGLDVVCIPALSRDVAIATLRRPSDRLRAFQLWLYESLALSEYKRRGWI